MKFLPTAAVLWLSPDFGNATGTKNLRSGNTIKGQVSLQTNNLHRQRALKGKPTEPTDPPGTTTVPTDPPDSLPYPTCTKDGSGEILRLMTMEEVESNKTYCNTVFYNRVYWMDEGGPAGIERNCGKDATWLFENLQCISMVPDHFEGMLSMCAGYTFGVIKGSDEDPCKTTDDGSLHLIGDSSWVEPAYDDPDFSDCDVYYNITCDALQQFDSPLLDLPSETVGALGPSSNAVTQRRWTIDDVVTAQAQWYVNLTTNFTEHCYTILHDYVYDLAMRPLDGSDPFYKKHGNGLFPQAILNHCGKDMTSDFDAVDGRDELCVPNHALGGMNVLSGYLVGVKINGEHDSCEICSDPPSTACESDPPDACEYSKSQEMYWYEDVDDVNRLHPESVHSCHVILQGGVYNLAEFSKYHAGGPTKITSRCGTDVTKTFTSKTFHKQRIFIKTLQDFQTGFIMNSTSDPCDMLNYDETLFW